MTGYIILRSFRNLVGRIQPTRYILFLAIFLIANQTFASHVSITINITGVNTSLRQELETSISLGRQVSQEHFSPARIRSLHSRSITEIHNTLKSYGYYHSVIQDELRQDGENWIAEYKIERGEAVMITGLKIEIVGKGATDDDLNAAVNSFPLRQNQQLNHALYETGKRRIQTLARDRGYFDAEYSSHTIHINESEKTAEIELIFDSGERYLFGDITITDTVVDFNILNRMIPFKKGDPYNSNLLITLGQRLRTSNYFNEVLVNPELDAITGNMVPITVTLTPQAKNNIRIGAGYSTDSGFRLLGAWESRYFNTHGHRVLSDLKISQTTSTVSGSYIMPDFRQRGPELRLLSSLSRENVQTHTSNIFTFGAQQQQIRWGWNERLSLTYQYENFEIADVSNSGNLLIPGIAYLRTVTDDPVYTTDGFRLNLSTRGSLKGALSNLTFAQAMVGAKYVISFRENNRLITRGEFGATYVSEFDNLPASIRFFAGGDNSIRGFDYQTLGPKNDDGQVIGGKYLTVGSIEYEYRFYQQWSAAVFTDFGNAYDNFSDDYMQSAGIGIRWRTPVGLIRIDFAFGVSENPTPFRLHINVGPDL
jgi:translocation and assembly module TamA